VQHHRAYTFLDWCVKLLIEIQCHLMVGLSLLVKLFVTLHCIVTVIAVVDIS